MKKILVTGGTGFIGTNLIIKLLQAGHHVTVLDNLNPQVHGQNATLSPEIEPYVSFIKGNIQDYHICEQALQNQDIVIHLAADTATGQSMYDITKCTQSNINGTANLLQCLSNHRMNLEKFIFASSRAVYGEGKYMCPKCGIVYPKGRNIKDIEQHQYEPYCPICHGLIEKMASDEKSILMPQSIYGITKLTQEQYISTICGALEIPYTILRFQNVYGEGQSLTNPYTGILSIFSSRILTGNPIYIFEDGLESRDFIHVQDVVSAILKVLEKNKSELILNVGSGHSISLIKLVKLLYHIYGFPFNYKINYAYRLGDIRHNYADISLIRETLGFKPSVLLEDGLLKFKAWTRNMSIFENNYEESLNIMKGKGILKT